MDEIIELIKKQESELANFSLNSRLKFPAYEDRRTQVLNRITERELIENTLDSLEDLFNKFLFDITKIKHKYYSYI